MTEDRQRLAVSPAQRLGEFISEAALNPAFDADKFISVVRLHLEIQDREDKGDFNVAFAAVQGEMEPIARSAENRHLGNKYAALDAIDMVLRPLCKKHGLSTRFSTMDGAAEGFTRKALTVSLGRYSETNWIDIPVIVRGAKGGVTQMTDQQAVGSVSTYGRRYLLREFFNISTVADKLDDDDGEGTRNPAGNGKTTVPDPKAVVWKDKTVELMASAQTEAGVHALWKQIKTNYEAAAAAWPDMAKEIDDASMEALNRIRSVQKPETTDGGWPSPDEQSAVIAG